MTPTLIASSPAARFLALARFALFAALAAFALLPAACGGSASDAEEPDDADETSGGEATEDGDSEDDEGADEDYEDSDDGDVEEDEDDDQASADDEDSAEDEDEDGDVDPRVAWRQSVGRGRSVFRQACDTCHPNGEDDLGPTLRRIRWTTRAMRRQIRQGSGRMRPIPESQLPERYMDDLMAYLSTFGAVVGVERPR